KDPLLMSRLYLNNSKGSFVLMTASLPDDLFSVGCVRAVDVDGDGDQDLFVGGRVIPGKYPFGPGGRLWRNDGKGHFKADEAFATLTQNQMITDAVWVDLDKDGFPELITVGEWQPVHVYKNNRGTLSDRSSDYIKFKSSGWWNRIIADDLNGDGQIDLVLGNQGWNEQFSASE